MSPKVVESETFVLSKSVDKIQPSGAEKGLCELILGRVSGTFPCHAGV